MSDLLTAEELAVELRCSKEKVYRMAAHQEIPAMRVGRWWRFDLDAVKAKLAAPPPSWHQSNRSRARKRVA